MLLCEHVLQSPMGVVLLCTFDLLFASSMNRSYREFQGDLQQTGIFSSKISLFKVSQMSVLKLHLATLCLMVFNTLLSKTSKAQKVIYCSGSYKQMRNLSTCKEIFREAFLAAWLLVVHKVSNKRELKVALKMTVMDEKYESTSLLLLRCLLSNSGEQRERYYLSLFYIVHINVSLFKNTYSKFSNGPSGCADPATCYMNLADCRYPRGQ